ncbi:MAG TPA: ABC transporter ATP-binding protein [Atopostipes sp.]|nr:ABC transporter ATP-binding protein [Atopostipes sp.]
MKTLLKYFKGYRLMSVLAPLGKLAEALLELTVPLIVVKIIDEVIPTGDRSSLLYYVGLMFIVAIVSLGFSLTAQFFSARAAIGFTKNLTDDLYKSVLSLSQSAVDRFTPGSLVNRITSDTFQIQGVLNIFFRLFLRSPFIVAGSLFMAMQIDMRITQYFVWMTVILAIIIAGIIALTSPFQNEIRNTFDRLVTHTREQMQGIRVIRAFNQEKREQKEFNTINESLTDKLIKTGNITVLTTPLTFVVVNVTLILLIWNGATFVYEGTLTQGEIVALVNYLLAILVELTKLVLQVIRLNRGWISGKRVAMILNYDAETDQISNVVSGEMKKEQEPVSADTPDLAFAFNGVDFRYPTSEINVLNDITFQVNQGETFGIIGGTGSGKSTILHLLESIYLPTAGEIVYSNDLLTIESRRQLRDAISVVSGKVALFKGTIRSNLLISKADATDDEMWEALADAQAIDFVKNLDEGLDAPVAAFGRNFSGGQRQRLTIARALLKPSEILIFDDATSALDYLTEANLLNTLTEKYNDRTLIMVSQRTRSLEQADQIIVMDAGDQVGLGTHEELLESNQIYREIYESQLVKEVE